MGKLTLLLVVAASIGGAYLTLNMRGALGDSARARSGEQADLLARQIAESGHGLALSSLVGTTGFDASGLVRSGDIDPGEYEASVVDSLLPQRAVVTVRGSYGGAVHTISSDHEFDPMDYPGPVWIDVPYATFDAAPGVQISGGAQNLPVRYDRRQNDAYRLGGFLPAADLDGDLAAFATASGGTTVYERIASAAAAPARWVDLLDDLNVRDAEELFQAALGAVTATKSGSETTVDDTQTWGTSGASVTVVEGGLRLEHGARLSGSGALVVDGAFVMSGNARLEWTGLVIIRSDAAVMPVTFGGNRARITGGLVIVHRGFPPGGHLDVTVQRAPGGMTSEAGDRTGAPAPWNAAGFPWFTHNHEFDLTPTSSPRGRRVVFAEGGGAGPHESETRFWDLLTALGSQEVFLEFENETHHGFSRYTLDLDGAAPLSGTVRGGFGPFARGTGSDRFRTQPFPADDLDELTVEVMALRSLQARFDGVGGCDSWPFCIGENFDRRGALTVQVKRASDSKRLYDAALYWHMREDEVAQHEAEENAWRATIASGAGYGAHISLGAGTRVTYDARPILDLADALGFDGNRLIQRGLSHSHQAAPVRSAAAATSGGGSGGGGSYWVCHGNGGGGYGSLSVPNASAQTAHLGHGDYAGQCTAGAPASASS